MLNPSQRSSLFTANLSRWNLVDALYGGTETMRLARTAYLIKNEKESEKDYNARLNRSTLYNVYKRSIQQATARAFTNDVALEGYPGEITIFEQDVDAQGRDLTQFSKATFTDALKRGVSYILVDLPKTPEQPLTLADSISLGIRPYWVPIGAPQVLAAYSTQDGGAERLKHFRFEETFVDVSPDGLQETTVTQIKAFNQANNIVTFAVYRKDDKNFWYVYDEGVIEGVIDIPVVPVYTNRTGFFTGEPPLLDLAYLNVQHWNSSSEQTNLLHVARVPFLHIKGMGNPGVDENGNKKEMEISIHSILNTGENGDAKWVETNGSALDQGFKDMTDIEAKMEAMGMMMTTPKPGTVTATETAVNAGQASSLLRDYALALADSLEAALYFTQQFLGMVPVEGSVVIDTSFTVDLEQTQPTGQQTQDAGQTTTDQPSTQGA